MARYRGLCSIRKRTYRFATWNLEIKPLVDEKPFLGLANERKKQSNCLPTRDEKPPPVCVCRKRSIDNTDPLLILWNSTVRIRFEFFPIFDPEYPGLEKDFSPFFIDRIYRSNSKSGNRMGREGKGSGLGSAEERDEKGRGISLDARDDELASKRRRRSRRRRRSKFVRIRGRARLPPRQILASTHNIITLQGSKPSSPLAETQRRPRFNVYARNHLSTRANSFNRPAHHTRGGRGRGGGGESLESSPPPQTPSLRADANACEFANSSPSGIGQYPLPFRRDSRERERERARARKSESERERERERARARERFDRSARTVVE